MTGQHPGKHRTKIDQEFFFFSFTKRKKEKNGKRKKEKTKEKKRNGSSKKRSENEGVEMKPDFRVKSPKGLICASFFFTYST